MIYIIVCVVLSEVGQLFFKLATKGASTGQGLSYYLHLFKNGYIWIGGITYGIGFLLWLRILKSFDLSYARPFVGFGYVLAAVLSLVFLKETITPLRWIGIALIVAGVYLVSMTSKG